MRLAFAVGATAIAAPILISVRLAWRQSVAHEEDRVSGYAADTLRRADETGDQIVSAFRQVSESGFEPCSDQDIALMRELGLGSPYLQGIGRLEDDTLICTSLGTTDPIPLGPATLRTETGSSNWLRVRIPVAGYTPMAVVAKDGIAVLINPELPLDTAMEGPDVALSLFVPSSQSQERIIGGRGTIRPEWYRQIRKGTEETFLDGGYVVSVARSRKGDIAAVAAAPQTYVWRQVRRFAAIFIPIGVLCGLALAGTVAYISRVRLSLPSVLRGAARRREFFVEYQPIIDLESQHWIGAEALVRWNHVDGVAGPDLFIPTAEESGVVTEITECVADIVAADLPLMLQVDPDFSVAINLSAADLRSEATLALLKRTIEAAGARPENLQVEATERGFLQGEETRARVAEMRALGIRVAIDDFGTGYSSLSRLEMLEPDALKIDKSFVDAMGTDGVTSQVVPHIIELGRTLRLTVVAEGVETQAQAEFLRHWGVRFAQGWLFGKAMGLKELCERLAAQRDGERELAGARGRR